MPLKIAIIGAGPAGCLLARLLQQSKEEISVTIFESEGDINFRSQGGTLDLHVSTGQAALKAAGLYDEFLKDARFDGESIKICDKNLLCYVKASGQKGKSTTGRPEIDRPKLRELLYNSLAPGTVSWNHKLIRVDSASNLHFADGSVKRDFDLVVGADGAWSHVRARVSSIQPFFSGIGGHSFTIPDAEKKVPELYDLVNRGSLFAFSDAKSIMGQYMGDGSLNVGTWARKAEGWQKESGYDVHDAVATQARCREEYADWDPRLLAFTQQEMEEAPVPRDLYMLPIGHRWEHVPGVTLVGDAAHLMTPFAGEGVNLALSDSLKLSQAIISATSAAAAASNEENTTQLDTNVAAFEQDMFARATKTQQLTYDMMAAKFMTPGAPRSGIERYILAAMSDEVGYWVTTLLMTPLVYSYFFVFKLLW